MNNYQTIDEYELSSITGGNKWGDAVNESMKYAKVGVIGCGYFGGAWGAAICGVAGAGLGAYIGYHKKH